MAEVTKPIRDADGNVFNIVFEDDGSGNLRPKQQVAVIGSKVADYEVADISATDHTFAGGITDAIYVDTDANVVLTINGKDATWKLFAGANPYRATAVVKLGTDAGVVIRGLYGEIG